VLVENDEKFEYKSPEASDPENDEITIEVNGQENSQCNCVDVTVNTNNFIVVIDRSKVQESEELTLEIRYNDDKST